MSSFFNTNLWPSFLRNKLGREGGGVVEGREKGREGGREIGREGGRKGGREMEVERERGK